MRLHFLPVTAAFFAAIAHAAPASAVATAGSTGVFSAMVQVAFALALVLGLIIVGAWLMRRFSLLPRAANGQLKVVSGVMVGTRERVVIVELGETWLVVGVTSEQVNLLHTQPKPAEASSPPAPALPPFAQWLQQAMRKRGVNQNKNEVSRAD